ncbi:unc-83 [Pristionchus pacificus]|nr:unc-83 [Pristionchus pacificus]|eukprot:PDM80814.1 unc-83 [Pristionchus pacificus]
MVDIALRSEEEEQYSQRTRVDLFEEKCSSLYNLILDQLNDDLSRECPVDCLSIEEMAADVIEMQLRVHTISSAMEQLRLRRTTSDCESNASRMAPFAEIRSWIHSMENKLTNLEERYKGWNDTVSITKLQADQQVLQLEIHNEGQSFFSRLDHLSARPQGISDRRQNCIEGVRKRWHTLYINSLSLQCCLENKKSRLTEDEASESDPELSAPPSKRLRRGSEYSETEEEDEEYCSSMDRRNVYSSSDTTAEQRGDWEQRDIGYSSGENSIHDTLMTPSPTLPSDLRRIGRATVILPNKSGRYGDELNSSPFKFSDGQNLSDSLIVNESMTTSKEYDEVLALLEDNESVHSGTNWRELRGRISPNLRKSKELIDGKQSCDASSEESSSWECDGVNEQLLSTSLHSHLADDFFSLKRTRGSNGRLNLTMLTSTISSEMDASFCSTRSENPIRSSRMRGMRKKIRPRRLPRSMSDGEHLGLTNTNYDGMDTPIVHISPPSTPLASSLSLLRRLDDDIIGDEQIAGIRRRYESGGEESANYEWDDYHKSSELLSVDEDFSKEFERKSELHRLVEESRANLHVVQSHLSTCNIDADVMRTVTLIADTNIRHLQGALNNGKNNEYACEDLESVIDEWRRVVSPLPRLVNQVRRFASSLRSLSSSSALPSGGIQTKEEAVKALNELETIRGKFESERDELRTLLSTSSSDVELVGMKGELSTLTQGYEEAVDKMSVLVHSVQRLNSDWEKWSSEQKSMRDAMLTLERRMKEEEGGREDNKEIVQQMELCQERMNSLETMCNYLSSHLISLQQEDDSSHSLIPPPDFSAELLLYSSALDQLKKRVHDHLLVPPVPSAPIVHHKKESIKRRPKRTNSTQTPMETQMEPVIEEEIGLRGSIVNTLRSSRFLQLLLLLSALCALAALVSSGVFKTTFGPHIEYVRGPPPV